MTDSSSEVSFLLSVNVNELSFSEVRKIEMSLFRILSYVRRFCGNESVANAIAKGEQLITLARHVQIALHALEIAEGPIGWLYALTTVIGTGLAASDLMMEAGA
jgi:hypothetical protein